MIRIFVIRAPFLLHLIFFCTTFVAFALPIDTQISIQLDLFEIDEAPQEILDRLPPHRSPNQYLIRWKTELVWVQVNIVPGEDPPGHPCEGAEGYYVPDSLAGFIGSVYYYEASNPAINEYSFRYDIVGASRDWTDPTEDYCIKIQPCVYEIHDGDTYWGLFTLSTGKVEIRCGAFLMPSLIFQEYYQNNNLDPEEFFNSMSPYQSIIINVPDFGSDPEENSLGLTVETGVDSEWYSWLPEAPTSANPHPENLTLQFKVVGGKTGENYRIKARLRGVSWYPAMWTNDYQTEIDLRFYSDDVLEAPWNCNNWLGAPELKVLDLLLVDDTNWSISTSSEPVVDGRNEVVQYATTSHSLSKNGSTTLEILPKDFAARGYLEAMIYLDGHEPTHFYPQFVYNRSMEGWPSNTLPIPRDEEMVQCEEGKPFWRLGDRLGDYWEEKYTYMDPTSSLTDSTIYALIQECRPFRDASFHSRLLFPNGTPDSLLQVGDGMLTFEKYRGFYGIKTDTIPEAHIRLSPPFRTLFAVPFNNADWVFADTLDRYYREYDLSYLNELPIRVLNMPDNNDYIYANLGLRLTDLSGSTLYVVLNPDNYYNFRYGTYSLNHQLRNMPHQQTVPLTWVEQFCDVIPHQVRLLFGDHNYVFRPYVRERLYLSATDTLGGRSAFDNEMQLLALNKVRYPELTWFNHTYLKGMINALGSDSLYNTLSDSTKSGFIRGTQSWLFAHEAGHSLGMLHSKYELGNDPYWFPTYSSIMSTMPIYREVLPTDSIPPNQYEVDDYRLFRMSR